MGISRKLIEVALPLEAINRESAREKSIRHGHPSTLHLWWARRPLAACRAVLFAQLVDDPSSHPDRFPTDEDQARERRRLFDLMEKLVAWENVNNDTLLRLAHEEIAACFDGKPPAVLDPFAGGGSIPLEAQRLGLKARASDLNPVAVLINQALIEIPPQWAGRQPVFPGAAESRLGSWPRATGLAEDVRQYGSWMRDEAERRIGHLFPKARLADGSAATVIAWIWARTVTCPNPACGAAMPLVRSFWLSKKRDRLTWVQPVVNGKSVTFDIVRGTSGPTIEGTVGRQGATCIVCDSPVPLKHIRAEGRMGRMGQQLMAVVAEGQRQRLYLNATDEHVSTASLPRPDDAPEAELSQNARDFKTPNYGMTSFADLFTNRQLAALGTFSELVAEARVRVTADAKRAGLDEPEADAYANAVSHYLGLGVSKSADINNALTRWKSTMDQSIALFSRQAIPMVWDFAENYPLGDAAGGLTVSLRGIAKALDRLPAQQRGEVCQADASTVRIDDVVVSTDPPYYDNIGYADLSDFFYVWLRRSLGVAYPDLLSTMLTPKAEELVATPYRFGGSKAKAEEHFERGFVQTFTRIRQGHSVDVPITVFYAFKQTESDDSGTASTGWETMLNGLIEAGLSVTATWPMRTELGNRMLGSGTNALASSIVLACRPRPDSAEATNRRGFIASLRAELPRALRELQQGSVAPVDLAQAAIGPGMAVYSRYARVVEPDGSSMTVRTALALINQVLDEVLSEQEGDFDADTRFCVKWFSQFGWDEQQYGRADELSRSTNTSVDGLIRGGVFWARAGKARLIEPSELIEEWDPATDARISVWEVVLRLARALSTEGAGEAARLMSAAGQRVDLDAAKELAYMLFSICEKRGWTQTALLFNGLGTSWSDLSAAARTGGALTPPPAQGEFDFSDGEE